MARGIDEETKAEERQPAEGSDPATAGRQTGAQRSGGAPGPVPEPSPEEVPELLGERSDYPLPRSQDED